MERRNFTKTVHSKEYEQKRFKNPFFESQEEKQKKSFKFLIIGLVLMLIAVPIILLFGGLFELKNNSVNGLTTIPQAEVETEINQHLATKWLNIIPKTHKWFTRPNVLRESLQNKYNFENISVKIEGDELKVEVEERISSLAWKSAGNLYFLDLDGKIFREMLPQERAKINERLGGKIELVAPEDMQSVPILQPTLPIIQDMSEQVVEIGGEVISPVTSEALISFDKNLRSLHIDPVIYQVERPHKPWLRVKTRQGYDILFDGLGDMNVQIAYLNSILIEYKEKLSEISYIDIRFENHIYIK
ncbi:hypothetical protein CO173_02190 [Candidatus Uhrbacteria bacterium CG_4_9_14_3_um_filter_41_35]|uniref:POTRA domain-containing protein n=1 Tax=Candidatus Uhrbacteria bacterium CG_4_9_14_3_um_filter_41_35 TaxID=1975034 RepID=A0A2M7XF99_9BACT|nr:MAG: hypothetical protein COV92_01205 [Candidatus Uhrbacteria bacterium CG11_big_fil_rev_8_21_14_0_20_41_9]PJA46554.1 MAG: hypothetical protein CO173_02190 [Candidatus Uhrbacteria bacterium CG_4_9_14_3_um_filter_41_35]